MALGKALGAGVPIGAALFSERVAAAARSAITAAPTAATCSRAARRCVPRELIDGGLISHVARVGAHLERGAARHRGAHADRREVRGAGLIWGLDLDRPAAGRRRALERGLLVNRTADTVVRLLPPLRHHRAESRRGLRSARCRAIGAAGGDE